MNEKPRNAGSPQGSKRRPVQAERRGPNEFQTVRPFPKIEKSQNRGQKNRKAPGGETAENTTEKPAAIESGPDMLNTHFHR